MKKTLLVFMSLALVLVFATPALANGADNYEYLTLEDSNDFTIVGKYANRFEIKAVGLDSSYTKHDISDPQNITWTTSDNMIAYLMQTTGDTIAFYALNEGNATITASYTCANGNVIEVPCNVVVEEFYPNSSVSDIDVKIKGDVNGSGLDIDVADVSVPLFSLKDVFGNSFDDADVLKKNASALHALLYVLEVENSTETYTTDISNFDWDWVSDMNNNVSIISQGSYVYSIDADVSAWPNGWQYYINGSSDTLSKSASIYELNASDTVEWKFGPY